MTRRLEAGINPERAVVIPRRAPAEAPVDAVAVDAEEAVAVSGAGDDDPAAAGPRPHVGARLERRHDGEGVVEAIARERRDRRARGEGDRAVAGLEPGPGDEPRHHAPAERRRLLEPAEALD